MDNRPVGVYDSGLGGLTVWREIRRQLPEESLVYLGDGKNCPYGARPADEICRLADEAVGRLVGAGCKMVVVACNTATAAAIDFLRRKYRQMPIVGMEPAVKPACLNTRSGAGYGPEFGRRPVPPHGSPLRGEYPGADRRRRRVRRTGRGRPRAVARSRRDRAPRAGADDPRGCRPDRVGLYALSVPAPGFPAGDR